MIAKLTVIFFIVLCLMLGIFLTLFPWLGFGVIGDWGDNYFLAFAAQTTGFPILQTIIASNWFRGAITGLGILNLFIAFWEMAHFSQSVEMLESSEVEAGRK
jgi:hypothetical protein